MPSISITANSGTVFSLIGVIRGTVTANVTASGLRPGQTINVDRLVMQADPTNTGMTVAYGDKSIANNGVGGRVLAAGVTDILQGLPAPTLNTYFSVSSNGAKFNLVWG